MLGFFRKYEKTFLLIVFAPALLALGVSGVMVSALRRAGQSDEAYRLFGREISGQEVSQFRVRNETFDQAMQRHAWLELAADAGVHVSEREMVESLKSQIRPYIIRMKVAAQLAKERLDPKSQAGRKRENELRVKYTVNLKVTSKDYDDLLRRAGLNSKGFEASIGDDLLKERLLKAASDLVFVTPAQLKAAYQDQHHKRSLQRITLYGKDHIPTAKDVTDDELKSYFGKHQRRYVDPRKVELHYLTVSLAELRKGEKSPSAADKKAFYEGNKNRYRAGGKVLAFSAVTAQVTSDVLTERAWDAIQSRLEKAHAKAVKGKITELAAIGSAMPVTYGTTGVVTLDELKGSPIDSQVARFWFGKGQLSRPSDVLLGKKAGYVLWADKLSPEKQRKLEEVRDRVVSDFVKVHEEEAKTYYTAHSADFRAEESFVIEALWVDYARFAKKIRKPDESSLQAYYEAAKKDFDGKPFAEVKAAVEKAYRLKKAKEQARELLDVVEGKYAALKRKKKSPQLFDFPTDSQLENARRLEYDELKLKRSEIAKNRVIGALSASLVSSPKGKLMAISESKDGKSLFLCVLKEKVPARSGSYEEAQAEVRKKILEERGYERTKKASDDMLTELAGLTGVELKAELTKLGLKPQSSAPFLRTDNVLDGFENAAQYISKAFSLDPAGPYSAKIERQKEGCIDLIRCAGKIEAPEDGYSAKREDIRRSAVNQIRSAMRERWRRDVMLAARSISKDHRNEALGFYTGGSKVIRLKLRQIALKPDPKILDKWMSDEAKRIATEYKKEIKADGSNFGKLAFTKSEDSATQGRDGKLGSVERGDITKKWGAKLEEAVYGMKVKEIRGPVESDKGFHILRLDGQQGARRRVSHVFVSKSKRFRQPSKAKIKEAMDSTKKRMEGFMVRLKAGESIERIGKELAKEEGVEGHERGEKFELGMLSEFQIKASPISAQEILTEPIVSGGYVHVIAARKEKEDPRFARFGFKIPQEGLAIFHVAFSTKSGLERAQAKARKVLDDIAAFRATYTEQGQRTEAPWSAVIDEFKRIAKKRSEAKTASKGGIMGVYEVDSRVKSYGQGWLQAVMALTVKPEGAAQSGLVELESGVFIIELVEAVKPKPREIDPHGNFEDKLIRNADWR